MVSPSYRLINAQANNSFIIKYEPFDLTTRWHYHPEFELIYFIKGKTSAIMGDGFKEFNEGDLVLLGSNFPHVLQENRDYKNVNPHEKPFGLIIQFQKNFLGNNFFEIPEMAGINQLLNKSSKGLKFDGKTKKIVCRQLLKMPGKNNSEKLLGLLDVLNKLSASNDFEYITGQDYYYNYTDDEERMRKVYEYVYKNFKSKIKIADVASVANMTETSFCRYFKARTLKNFTTFLNEIRIAYTCKNIKSRKCNIVKTSEEAGFNNFSYFCRTFKKIIKMTPYEYKKAYECF